MKDKTRGMGSIFQRGEIWYVQFYDDGRARQESTKSTARTDAVKLLKRRLGEVAHGRLVGPDMKRTRFKDLVELLRADYIRQGRRSLPRALQCCARLEKHFDRMRAVAIDYASASAYVAKRLEQKAAHATVRYELATLGRMLKLAVAAKLLPIRPQLPVVKVDNARQGFFEAEDLERVVAELPEHVAPLVRFLALTGWRLGETRRLTWRQVDFAAGVVRLEPGTTKNRDGRTFPFVTLPALAELLAQQRERTAAVERETRTIVPWVFHRQGKPLADFYAAWRSACRRALVPGKLLHDLRRTAVRNLERAGVPRSWATQLTGHKTESVYRRYAIVSEADLATAVSRLSGLAMVENRCRTAATAEVEGAAPSVQIAQLVARQHAGTGIRTQTGFPPADFKSAASTVPPSRQSQAKRPDPLSRTRASCSASGQNPR